MEETKIKACADALKPCGFVSRQYPNLRIEKHAEKHFALVTSTSDRLQLAIAAAVNSIVEKPLLAAVSSNEECGLMAMGAESIIRRVLLVLKRDIWCRLFPRREWGLGWNRRTTLMFRSHGAEHNPEVSIRLLNPHCEDKVRRRFGDFPGMEKLVEGAAAAIPRLTRTIKQLAQTEGPMLPEDSLELWKQDFPLLAQQERESYAVRVSQAQWLTRRVTEDCVAAVVATHGGMHRELFGISGWIANMGKSMKSLDVYKIFLPSGTAVESQLVIPCEFAVPNAVNALVQARDLVAHYEKMGISKPELVKRLPTYCQWWNDLEQLNPYIRQEKGVASADGSKVIDSKGLNISPIKPLSCFPQVDKCSRQASTCICNSKPVESSFSPMKVVGRGKGQASFALLSMLYRKHNFRTALIDAETHILKDEARYWKAHNVAMLPGWDWVNLRDDVLGDVFRDADLEDQLQKKSKTVARGGKFAKTGHGGTSRTNKYSGKTGHGSGKGRERKRANEAHVDCLGEEGISSLGQSRKRARRKSGESPLNTTSANKDRSDSCNQVVTRAKTVRRVMTPARALEGDRIIPRLSTPAKLSLARKRAAIEKERRQKRYAELRKDLEERMELARADSDSDAYESAVVSDRDDDEYVPHHDKSSVASTGLRAHSSCCRSSQRTRKTSDFPLTSVEDQVNQDCHPANSGSSRGSTVAWAGTPAPASAMQSEKAPAARVTRMGQPGPQPHSRARGGRGGGSRSTISERQGLPGLRRAEVRPVQKDARGRSGKTSTKKRKQSAREDNYSDSSSMSSSAPGNQDVEDDDIPLFPAKYTGHPGVGTKIAIWWNETHYTGWFRGTVKAISDGTLSAPAQAQKRRKRKRLGVVQKGFTIVEYDDKTEFVHLLDEDHHVSKLGSQAGAWQTLSDPGNKACGDSGAVIKAKPISGAPGSSTDSSDDDLPLLRAANPGRPSPTQGGSCSAAVVSAAAACEAGPSADSAENVTLLPLSSEARVTGGKLLSSIGVTRMGEREQPNKNVWSMTYCFQVFDNIQPEQFRLGIAKYSAGHFIVTRQMPEGGKYPKEADIKIHVETEQSKVCYIVYSEETGVTLLMVTRIRKPIGEDWSNTLRGYQMFTTEQALARVDAERDTITKGCSTSWGAASLRYELALDKSRNQTTYHPTDWEVPFDVRCVVGVVRQAQAKDRECYDRSTHAYWPAKTSLIFTGLPYSESH